MTWARWRGKQSRRRGGSVGRAELNRAEASPCVSLCRLPNACPTHADEFRVSERVRQAWARTGNLRQAQEALTHRRLSRILSQTHPASS